MIPGPFLEKLICRIGGNANPTENRSNRCIPAWGATVVAFNQILGSGNCLKFVLMNVGKWQRHVRH